ncbi:GNAT family N-acetyltransferase [Pseudogemmobacter blasticus]|uniref:GNAT family N-acetyltransferase n=1 Tax=Fuscovulum blasticum DSM 2131 TaxID=1188250 RepID=A0A2T4J7B4_FUSBL|nr:GNAT family N-acetyltransferase [Fuscovulum blasticum]PTE13790.1 GNAT family N-acetyltransferase [Fuscovulum blasticum DSM 2131]
MTAAIRDIAAPDKAPFHALWQGYLDFYGVTLTPEVTARTWARLLDPASPLRGRVAAKGDALLGFALSLTHPSSWVAGEDCYLEDLFVAPQARGQGLGRALIDDLITQARARGCHRLYWHTRHDNAQARKLYDSYVQTDDHIRYRLTL